MPQDPLEEDWMDIESAPKNDTPITVFYPAHDGKPEFVVVLVPSHLQQNGGGGHPWDINGRRPTKWKHHPIRQKYDPTRTKLVAINPGQIVVDRQALLDVVAALDINARLGRVPAAMDKLREPFFTDELTSGKARLDFSKNQYEHTRKE